MGLYTNKKVLIIGLGLSGRAAALFLLKQGALVTGADRDQNLLDHNKEIALFIEQGMCVELDSKIKLPLEYDLIIVSPGVPSTHPLLIEAKKQGIETIGEIELGCRVVKNPVLGITGTNGKTTVTMLVTHVLEACGLPAKALGNVGIPFSQELLDLDAKTTIVLELSSYQLETLSQQVLDGGVILNITPDHLDRYPGMEEYAAAKLMMENCLKSGAPLYLEDKTYQAYGHHLKKVKVKTYGYAPTDEIYTDLIHVYHGGKVVFSLPETMKHKRSHDIENMMAAYALCVVRGITGEQFLTAFLSFHKPPHRIEFVLSRNGISYYDDSKGTNIDAVIRAVEAFNASIILIAGGVDKGAPYTPWLDAFGNKVKCICAIGQAAPKMKLQLSHRIPVTIASDLKQAVQEAASMAKEGDVVLLSPGCSSFDMFKDYAHRGQAFQQAVREL